MAYVVILICMLTGNVSVLDACDWQNTVDPSLAAESQFCLCRTKYSAVAWILDIIVATYSSLTGTFACTNHKPSLPKSDVSIWLSLHSDSFNQHRYCD